MKLGARGASSTPRFDWFIALFGSPLRTTEKLLGSKTHVFRDLPQERWGDVLPRMKRNSRSSAVGMPVLLVRTALPNLQKAQAFKKGNNFPRLERGQVAHYAT